jgi:hypothetical protein
MIGLMGDRVLSRGGVVEIEQISLDRLIPHPCNSNVMHPDQFEKLVLHLGRTGRYPPVIVRPWPGENEQTYQILDGHHRVEAIKRVGGSTARCMIWPVNDDEALVLLATLNRLQGRDDPYKRAGLIEELGRRIPLEEMERYLPENLDGVRRYLTLNEMPAPRAPPPLQEWPVAVHFFLLPEQKKGLESRLKEVGGSREDALMKLVMGTSC